MAVEPLTYCVEKEDLGKGRWRTTYLAYPKYKQVNGTWRPTEAVFDDKAENPWLANGSVHELRVNKDGWLDLNHPHEEPEQKDTLRLRVTGLGVLDNEGRFLSSLTPRDSLPVRDPEKRNVMRWADYMDGVDLDVVYGLDQVRTVLTIKNPAELLARQEEGRLAVRYETNSDHLGEDIWSVPLNVEGPLTPVRFVCFGAAGAPRARLAVGSIPRVVNRGGTSGGHWVLKDRNNIQEMYHVVPWEALKSAPKGPVVVKAVLRYLTRGSPSYSACDSTHIWKQYPDSNYCDWEEQAFGNWGGELPCPQRALFRFIMVPGVEGTITDAKICLALGDLYLDPDPTTGAFDICEVNRDWVACGANWRHYADPCFTEPPSHHPTCTTAWETDGAEAVPQDRSDKIGDTIVWGPPPPPLPPLSIGADIATEWNYLTSNNGVIFYAHGHDTKGWLQWFASTSYDLELDRPKLEVYHT